MRKVQEIIRADDGATIVEFALLGPMVIGMMIAVLQLGMAMQSYNAVRSVTAETARYALVEYQKGNDVNNATIEATALDLADGAPYLLMRQDLTVSVADAGVQRVNGARELTVDVSYRVPNILPFFDWTRPTVTHARPIFLLDS